jgi:uncharacterized repeat protein (TIGR01451 family)
MKTTAVAMMLLFTFAAFIGLSPRSALGFTGGRADVTEIVGKPGQTVHFNVLLNYTTTDVLTSLTYSLGTRNLPEDWTTKVYYSGQEIKALTIANSQVLTIDLQIEIPETAEAGSYSFWFQALSQELAAEGVILELKVDVEAMTRVIELSSNYPSVEVLNNGSAQFSMTINNSGDTDELLYLSAMAPKDWITNFKSQGAHIFQIYLQSGYLATIQVELIPPFDAYGAYDIAVRAQSADKVVNSTLDLNVVVSNSTERTISTLYPVIGVQAGKIIEFPLVLRNLGPSSNTFRLSALSVPPGWTVSFVTSPGGSTSIKAISLDSGGTASLYLEETPPAAITTGSYTITVQVESATGSIYVIDLTTMIVGSYNLTIEPSTLLTSVVSGEPATFTVRVTNTGQTAVSGVTVGMAVPTSWGSSLTPVSTALLQPLESYTFTTAVSTTSDTVAGDYLVTLTAVSDQVNSGSVQVRVTVTTSTSWGLWGFGVAIAVIIVLAAVFLKLRRR